MAITILQTPNTPNMVNADLVYEVSSNLFTSPQFQFVMDIQDESKTVLQTIKQQPNPSGYGVFDIGNIVANYVDIDPVWKTEQFATSSFANKQFWVAFGEEYGTSLSSSVTLYNGSGVAGSPAKSGSFALTGTNGLVEVNSGDWNFPTGSYVLMETASDYFTFSHQAALTNAPFTQKIQDGEYATISAYNGNFDGNTLTAQDIAYVIINVFSGSTNIQNYQYENLISNGGGPRTSMAQAWSAVAANQNETTNLIHVGVGPQNIDDNGTALNAAWNSYTVKFVGQGDDGLENSDGVYAEYRFNKDTANCDYPGVRFAWKNEFGVWDYYTAKLAVNSRVAVERNSYNQTFVDYSTTGTRVPYNISRRGSQQFYNKLNQSFNVTTDILNQTDAEWLRELFFSVEVFVQEGTDFLPVVLKNVEVIEKTNPRSQKVFQYAFDYEYANQLRPRL